MKFNDIVNNRIEMAKQKLSHHRNLGSKSALSIREVAELLDIVNGNGDLSASENSLFFGLYSMN